MKRHVKRVIYDVVGILLILISPFLDWIPGPGGIPVFLAGLGLLAVHNDWAKRILDWAKINADHLLASLFPRKKSIERVHDAIGILLIILSGVAFYYLTPPLQYILAIALLSSATFWLLYNRRRYHWFIKKH
ncbi:MAG TPA: hypothetical protein PKV52_02450 [Candidatus Saccharibacteria bacterium]|nr:hypothetical protein [Candidatus Saccharibacteria bacterium]